MGPPTPQTQGVMLQSELEKCEIAISMSGKGRCFDNILAERSWRTVKYEEVYLRDYDDGHVSNKQCI